MFLAIANSMRRLIGTISGKNAPRKTLNISEILDGMREDQQQFEKKIAELRAELKERKLLDKLMEEVG